MFARNPNQGHQLFMRDMHAVCDRFEAQGIPPIEQIAILSQLIGQKCTDLSALAYDSAEVMRCVALGIQAGNSQAGNSQASGSLAIMGHG